MNGTAHIAYAAWKAAHSNALDAESRLRAAWDEYEQHGGKPPPPAQVTETSGLRALAKRKLTYAMKLIG
jgi:hypothetical protein